MPICDIVSLTWLASMSPAQRSPAYLSLFHCQDHSGTSLQEAQIQSIDSGEIYWASMWLYNKKIEQMFKQLRLLTLLLYLNLSQKTGYDYVRKDSAIFIFNWIVASWELIH